MKKEYIRPEAEMMKFVESDEIMNENDSFAATMSAVNRPYDMGL